jgi:acetylglutamate kinase
VNAVVLKVGGASTAGIAAAVERLGARVCVVHGAGPQISAEMERRGLEVRFVRGRRVTTPEALDVVRESFAQVRAAICAELGARAVPLAGDEIGLEAVHVPELGLVGRPVRSAPQAVLEALAAGLVPVVSPLARGPLNVNADEAAAALALGIGAARIHFLTDVPGVYQGGELMRSLDAATVESLVRSGAFEGGIVPKVLAAARAARSGMAAEIGTTLVVA